MAFAPRDVPNHFWVLAILCSILPDADVIGFFFGVPYRHVFGHRGFFHSPFFGLLLGALVAGVSFRDTGLFTGRWFFFVIFFSLLTASHGLLDALTNGGLGIALLSPFDNTRHFLPWTQIEVSPIGIQAFFSKWGLAVIKSELLWIWLPSLAAAVLSTVIRGLYWRH